MYVYIYCADAILACGLQGCDTCIPGVNAFEEGGEREREREREGGGHGERLIISPP